MGISGYSWLMLTLVWLLSFAVNLMVLAPAPLLGAIMSELGLTHSEAGLLVALPPLMYVLLSLFGGSLADRWCPKRVAGLGSLLMFVGGVVRGLVGSVDALFVFTAVAGASVALTIPNLPKVISSWFPSDRIGVATGFYVTTFSIGPAVVFAATPTILLPILGSWRATLTFYSLFASAASILWWLLAKNRLVVVGSRSSFKEVLKVRDVWLLGFITTTANMLWYGVSGWLPYILLERGFDEATAGLVATLYTLTSVPAFPICIRSPWLKEAPDLCPSTSAWSDSLLSSPNLSAYDLAPISPIRHIGVRGLLPHVYSSGRACRFGECWRRCGINIVHRLHRWAGRPLACRLS
jgi:CP family cyanate transporter-like MFS transporter